MSKQINERKDTSQINIMKSELIMKNSNTKKKNYKKKTQKTTIGYYAAFFNVITPMFSQYNESQHPRITLGAVSMTMCSAC